MKTEEDEAFDEIARKHGMWGGGFMAKKAMAADKLWDRPSVAFDEWWNGDNDESTNPYRLESGAYWAWAGWKAALAGREWNFCERCGKRTKDMTVIHTCTPPQAGE